MAIHFETETVRYDVPKMIYWTCIFVVDDETGKKVGIRAAAHKNYISDWLGLSEPITQVDTDVWKASVVERIKEMGDGVFNGSPQDIVDSDNSVGYVLVTQFLQTVVL